MAYTRKVSSRRKGSKRTYKRKSYAPKKRSMPLRQMVKREIARNIEDKNTQYYNLEKTIWSSASALFQDNVIELGPNGGIDYPMPLTQGTGVGSRIGNKVKTKKLMFKGTIVPLPYNGSTNITPVPVQGRIVIFYDRSDPNSEPQPATNFFQNANANTGFYNDLTDLWRPINTDRYRILASKTFKLGAARYDSNGTGYSGAQYYENNDFKYNVNFSFDLTKHYPKLVKFDDGASTPTTRGLWALVYYAAANGGIITAGQALVTMQWMVDYHYEDA